MAGLAGKRDVAVSMRLPRDDLGIIDKGAGLTGLSRTEFVRQAALHRAQLAILNETTVRMSPESFDDFVAAISRPPEPMSRKMLERLRRRPPWENR